MDQAAPTHSKAAAATRVVGIDLGTTISAVAYVSETGQTTMLRNSFGEILTPSVVLFTEGNVVVGKPAKQMAGVRVGEVAECAKRDMGSKRYAKTIRGKSLPPEVIQACILQQLRQDIVAVLGETFQAVVTVPAYFDEPRRKATADAAEMAGLSLLDIVNEPTAAALAFGEHVGYLTAGDQSRKELKVLVYDLGGGTFDVTVLRLRPGDIRALATDGDVLLGGHDWDQRLADYVAEAFIREHGPDPRQHPGSNARLMSRGGRGQACAEYPRRPVLRSNTTGAAPSCA